MKKILLIVALAGFTLATASAQEKKNCGCKSKTVHRKAVSNKPDARTIIHDDGVWTYTTVRKPVEPCTSYRKNNIVVTECPGIFYDNSDLAGFKASSTYSGYYPRAYGEEKIDPNAPVAPQHTTISNYKGVAPAGGNGCEGNCTAW